MGREQRFTYGAILLLATLLWAGGPAIAHHKTTHEKGAAGVTEDNDGDGVRNTPDPSGDADNLHPSGKDRHAEGGASGAQGSSSSDPDDDGRGPDRGNGLDKPGGDGGLDTLDQDGNNGCGNDDDFEDDNEGWCLGPQKARGGTQADASLATRAAALRASVLAGEIEVAGLGGAGDQAETVGDAAALGAGVEAGLGGDAGTDALVAGSGLGSTTADVGADALGAGALSLPVTGASTLPLATAALGLLGAGAAMLRLSRRR